MRLKQLGRKESIKHQTHMKLSNPHITIHCGRDKIHKTSVGKSEETIYRTNVYRGG
jgi:hypothetical protein